MDHKSVEFIEEMFIEFKKEYFKFLIYLHTESNIESKEAYNIAYFLFKDYLKKLYSPSERYKIDKYSHLIKREVMKVTVYQDNH